VKECDCTGCAACANLCPAQAITMEKNTEGFPFPRIDEKKCISCGLCFDRCPAIHVPQPNQDPDPKCFALRGSDDLVLKSSSGGAFSILAEHFLSKGGVVCGAAYAKDNLSVEHIFVSRSEDLYKLRTSKYMQSDIGFCYREIKSYLAKGTPVLFVGCPCQCAGLRAYLGRESENLLIVDIVCHGVPSSMVFEKFVESLKVYSNVTAVSFREKKQYGWTPTLDIHFENGKEYYKPKWESSYYDAFLKGIACRLSCGHCPFARIPRQGDITLGDFWGISAADDKYKGSLGTSLVLLNNKKGEQYKEALEKGANSFEKKDVEITRKNNGNVFFSSPTNKNRERFFTLIKKYDFQETMNRIKYRHFEIGLVGWWYGRNYGSALTYFALNRLLTDLGFDVLMLDWPVTKKPTAYDNNDARRLANQYYQISIQRTFEEYPNLNKYIDVFAVGSDQMWNCWGHKNMSKYYLLDFADNEHPKVAISTSFGHSRYVASEALIRERGALLKRFSAISVREDTGVTVCNNVFGVPATNILDPVFVVDKKHYEELIEGEEIPYKEKYLFCYILTPTKEKGKVLNEFAKKMGLKLVICLDNQTPLEKNKEELGIEDVEMNVGIRKWLAFIRHAEYVVTDSYHGTCFSILFRKKFLCIINYARGATRFESLLKICGLEDRGLKAVEDVSDCGISNEINYDRVEATLSKEIKFSSDWIKRSLNNALKQRRAIVAAQNKK